MKEALTRVRRDLGGDAVILSAREVRRRRLFGLGSRAVGRGHGQRHDAGGRRSGNRMAAVPPGPSSRRSPSRMSERPSGWRLSSAKSSGGCTRWSRP